jgi:hypothetical protein
MYKRSIISICLASLLAGPVCAQEQATSNNDVKSIFSPDVSVRNVVGQVHVEQAKKRDGLTVPNSKNSDTFAIRAINKKLREIKETSRPTQNLGDPLEKAQPQDAKLTKSEIANRIVNVKESDEVADAMSAINATSEAVANTSRNIDGSLQSPEVLDKAIHAVDKAVEDVEKRERQKSRLKLDNDYTF